MKNLEAKDQIYRGIFRMPFAFLFGGPIGIITNTIFTTVKVNGEINRENQHKKYIESIIETSATQKKYIEERKSEDKRIKENKIKNIDFLKEEFYNCEDISYDSNFHLTYFGKEKLLYESKHYKARFSNGNLNDSWIGNYLPIQEFIKKYQTDCTNGNVIKKYRFFNNKIRATFGYKTVDGFFFTGMFVMID